MQLMKLVISGSISIVLATQLLGNDTTVQNAELRDDSNETSQSSNVGNFEIYGSIISGQIDALNRQKESDSIVNVVSSDGIGKLPDRNAAEAAARIPGVSIERDQGEGRFISVRGLPSQWSSTTLNGSRLPTAEQQTTSRATAFDFFPTEMIERIEVYKALRPDIEGDAIGGSVNFVTATAPDEQLVAVTAAYNYNDKAKEGGHNINLLYGDRFLDDKLGFLVDFTTYDRSWATDNFEARRHSGEHGIYRLELRDYIGERETYGLNTSAEYLIDDDNKLFFRGIYGSLTDHETNYKHRYRFDKFNPTTGGRVEVQNIFNTMEHESTVFEVGGEHAFSEESKLNWSLATYENSFQYDNTPNEAEKAYNSYQFNQNGVMFEGLEDRGDGYRSYNTIDGGISSTFTPSTHLPDSYVANPEDFTFATTWLWEGEIVEKDKIVAEFDWEYKPAENLDLKFGAKYRDKERTQKEANKYYTWDATLAGTTAPTIADFDYIDQPNVNDFSDALGQDYGSDFSKVITEAELVNWWNTNRDNFVLNESSYPTQTVENGLALSKNFKVQEQQSAAYGMGTLEYSDELSILGGVRLEHTRTKVFGKLFDASTGAITDNVEENDYLAVLPSLHVTYSPQANLKYRAAVTRSFARPDFGDLSTGGVFESNTDKYVVGNPHLDPTYSLNYDLMAEYYFGDIGIVSGGLFYKDISDPIFKSTKQAVVDGNTATVVTSLNGDDASLWGAEFAFNTQFDFLPGVLKSLGLNANITLMDSEMNIPGRSDTVNIPRQADLLYNTTLFFDDNVFNARLAYNYKGDYIMEHGSSDEFDEYYGENQTVDLSAGVNIDENFSLFAELLNITDEPLVYYQGDESRPLQYEKYGMRGQVGIKYIY